jgi:hypothetical protein
MVYLERLVKAKSDGSLTNSLGESSAIMSRLKSKSLEPLTGNSFPVNSIQQNLKYT